jgi:hypothetical protein
MKTRPSLRSITPTPATVKDTRRLHTELNEKSHRVIGGFFVVCATVLTAPTQEFP